ncbi:hypothetical protein HX001_12460 [Empedobacter brevis]|uniref:Lipoprotein n=2 Tax=Empedobacter brevis TaxID=247 RepID=A0A511NHF7_9FLAO|nr:hypothetical protein [Empedobacter brevis]MDM1073295.1 hypothetical protein [Empedobacter brevis]QES91944.1 hypothetical protein F0358_04055 [Empedobacter brevis]QHC83691.1 hypothetical protein AS589_02245 [Empedobacter brevis]GEM52249.1 hypothetical protein EB1_20390 [Empedobacter brevis NBRC 14943 = ATCC 43319]
MKTISKLVQFSIVLLLSVWIIFSCKDDKYNGDYNPEAIKGYKNESSTVSSKMDSVEAVNFIAKQKLRELYELSALASNTSDTVVDSLLRDQLLSYFPKKDTTEIFSLLRDLRAKKVTYTSVSKFAILPKDSIAPDSIKRIAYTVNYFNSDKKLIETNNHVGVFVLKQEPIKFQREFKFYFTTLMDKKDSIQKDSIPSGVIQKSSGKSPK